MASAFPITVGIRRPYPSPWQFLSLPSLFFFLTVPGNFREWWSFISLSSRTDDLVWHQNASLGGWSLLWCKIIQSTTIIIIFSNRGPFFWLQCPHFPPPVDQGSPLNICFRLHKTYIFYDAASKQGQSVVQSFSATRSLACLQNVSLLCVWGGGETRGNAFVKMMNHTHFQRILY